MKGLSKDRYDQTFASEDASTRDFLNHRTGKQRRLTAQLLHTGEKPYEMSID